MENPRFSREYRSKQCLNCGTPLELEDRYCHYCGQLNSNKKLSFRDFFNEFFGSLFSYDSRLYRTLNTLIFKPGKISSEYIQGKRTKYANPFRFYLSISIIFFLFYGLSNELTLEADSNSGIIDINNARDTDYNEVTLLPEKKLDSLGFLEKSLAKVEIYMAYQHSHRQESTLSALQTLKHHKNFYNKWLYKRAIAAKNVLDKPYNFMFYAIGKLPFVIFFFIPIFTLILWLTYGRTNYSYMEHLVFAFHSQTMLFFLMNIGLIFKCTTGSNLTTILLLIGYMVYLFQALRKFYNQSIVKTFIKFMFLNFIFVILAITTTGLAVLASFAVY